MRKPLTTCGNCRGTGWVCITTDVEAAREAEGEPCDFCGGTGRMCATCEGDGVLDNGEPCPDCAALAEEEASDA